jgi:conjugal transfer pilus assembly protein TraF
VSKELEAKKATLIMKPSVENAKEYIETQTRMFKRADEVSRVWQAALLKYPHLNPRIEAPMNQQAINIKKGIDEEKETEVIKQFAEDYGLIFFFRSDCKYCHAFAEILKVFAETYDFSVEAISMDGGEVAGFASKRDDNLVSKLEIKTAPALMAYSPSKGNIFPVAHGFMSLDELQKNALFVINLLNKHEAENAQNNR